MNLWGQKNRRFPAVFAILTIILIMLTMIGLLLKNISNKQARLEMGLGLLQQKKPEWQEYSKLGKQFAKLRRNWTDPGAKSPNDDNLGSHKFVQSEFDRQITEIGRISNAEERFKLEQLDQILQDYTNKRRQESNKEYTRRAATITDSLNRELQQKSMETAYQIRNFRHDLEAKQQLNLVNLQLQLSVLDFNTNKEESKKQKEIILEKIARVKQEVAEKANDQEEQLRNQLTDYLKQRRERAESELDGLKAKMQADLERELSEYKAKLDSEYIEWRQRQADEFAKAIKIRREQQKK